METLEPLLAEHPFFSGLTQAQLDLLTGCASNTRFEAGQFIFREGEQATRFFVIRHGKVSLEIYAPSRGAIIIATLGEGDILGWSWLFPPFQWKFDARALELTRALAMDGECLRRKAEEDHHLGFELLKRFAAIMEERLQATRLQLLNLYEPHA
jgi:CRP/FNR family cyclic AMP-dependent transcriptional regulator